MGMTPGCHQHWTEALLFMVFLHHPIFQAVGSKVLWSAFMVKTCSKHPMLCPWRAVPTTISLNDLMQVFSRRCLVFPTVIWRCQSTWARKPHLTLQNCHVSLHVLLPKFFDILSVHMSIPACLWVEPVPVNLAGNLE